MMEMQPIRAYLFHRVTFTMSPTSSLILGSSVQGRFAATTNPCDQIGTQDPVAAFCIE